MLAFWGSILKYVVLFSKLRCCKTVRHVAATAVTNSFSVSNTSHDSDYYVQVVVSYVSRQQ